MIKVIRITACGLLLFNGVGATGGGWMLMADPSGGKLQMPVSLLEHSPFTDFFIPGLILFLVNGILSLITLFLLLRKNRFSSLLVLAQGIVLTGWIVVQITMIRTVIPLHYIMGGTGILLVISGVVLRKNEPPKPGL